MASRPTTPTTKRNLNSYRPPPSVRLSPPPPSSPAVFSADGGSESSFRIVPQHGCGDPWAGETPPSTRPSTPGSICGRAGSWNGSTSSDTTTTTTTTTTTATTPHRQGALDNVIFPDLDLLLLPPNHRLPPRPSDLTDDSITITATSPQRSRDPSPSRLSVLASPLSRIAVHARSLSSPLNLGVEKPPSTAAPTTPSPSPRPGAAATLLANMFKTPDGSSGQSVKAQSVKGGFFGFKLPSTASPRNSRTIQSTDIIDEFAGLSFASLMSSFLTEPNPNETPSTPADVLKLTPEGRLQEAVATATDLLDRVYTAYRARTTSLGDALDDLENHKEDIVSHQTLNASLKTQLDRFITEERETAAQLSAQQKRITELECELRKRETADDELRLSPRRTRCTSSKRTSAASDSGFESDVDSISILSRSDARASTVVSPTEEVDEESDSQQQQHSHHDCESCRYQQAAAAQGAETKNPTPLREAWSPDNGSNNTNRNSVTVPSKPGVWGFFKGRQQQQQGSWGDIESVRMENRWLRERVREMEKAVDGALEAVAGRGIAL